MLWYLRDDGEAGKGNGPYWCKVLAFFLGTAREDTSWRGRRTENVRFGWFTVLIIKLVTTTRPDENVLFEHWYLEYYVPEDSSAESQSEQYFGALLRLVEITSISAACYGFEERRIVSESEGYTASEEVRRTTRLPPNTNCLLDVIIIIWLLPLIFQFGPAVSGITQIRQPLHSILKKMILKSPTMTEGSFQSGIFNLIYPKRRM